MKGDRNMKKNRSSLPHQPAQAPLPGYEIPEASRPSPINRVPQNRPGTRKSSLPFSLFSAVRIGLQILFFIWLPALYILAFSGLEQLVFSISAGKFSFSALWPVLIPLLAILAVSVFAGRFFCGWMCAFGALTDWVYRIFSRWTRGKIRVARAPDRLLKYLKYAVLAVLFALGIFAGSVSLSAWSPWDAFGMLFTVGYAPAISFVLKSLLPGLILLILTLLASAFIERFFCRYLCPMGAFFALTAGGRFVYIDKPTEKCGKCRICTKSCAMQIPLYQMDKVKSTECISCMKCVEVCPRNNVHGIAEFDQLSDGDVLIIPYSDVGWTPLFSKAGAVIAESGGILSHSSIIAREYHIPAVVSVADACRIPDRTIVHVNGFTGEITLQKDQTNAALERSMG